MTFIRFIEFKSEFSNRICKRRLLKCDNCGKEFEKNLKTDKHGQIYHFCSPKCVHQSITDGLLRKQIENTNLDRFNVKNPMQNFEVKNRAMSTNIERYGHVCPMKHVDVQEKARQTSMGNWGVENPAQSPIIKQRISETVNERYDVPWAALTDQCRSLFNSEKSRMKSHETRKKNGSFRTSKIEQRIFEICREAFENAKQWVRINGWVIDVQFKFQEKIVYLQVDGVFWHGLDRPLEQIHENARRTYDRDREQEKWFQEQELILIRLPVDNDSNHKTDDEILNELKKLLLQHDGFKLS